MSKNQDNSAIYLIIFIVFASILAMMGELIWNSWPKIQELWVSKPFELTRNILLSLTASVALFGIWLSWKRTRQNSEQIRQIIRQNDSSERGSIDDRFQKSIELLGSVDPVSRSAAIYILSEIANRDEYEYKSVVRKLFAKSLSGTMVKYVSPCWKREVDNYEDRLLYEEIQEVSDFLFPVDLGKEVDLAPPSVVISDCKLSVSILALRMVRNVTFINVWFVGELMLVAEFLECKFHNCNFENTKFYNCKIQNKNTAIFYSSNLNNAKFLYTDIEKYQPIDLNHLIECIHNYEDNMKDMIVILDGIKELEEYKKILENAVNRHGLG